AQEVFEGGLYAAEQVAQHGIMSAVPLRTKEGALSTLVEGSDGEFRPLALLRFVPGEPLRLEEAGDVALYGSLLGRTHRMLLKGGGERVTFSIYDFLEDEAAYVAIQPGLAVLIRQTIEAVRAYEKRCQVTAGVIWADRVEILCERETGRVGIIDWGAIERGPLLFDVALSVLWFFPEGSQSHEAFLRAYLAEAPILASELEGLGYYKALVCARQAKYFAYRVAANVTLGGSDSDGNKRNLMEARQALERLLVSL
ncbi:MAG: phosphotransferase, partial [Ktedonobacteraceae bacterium]|nr:phosphotransferase [Ktedonobacteraceae bacterium]